MYNLHPQDYEIDLCKKMKLWMYYTTLSEIAPLKGCQDGIK